MVTGAVQPEALPLLRLIPLAPLAAAVLHGALLVFVRRAPSRAAVAALSCGAPLLSFALSVWALLLLLERPTEARLFVDELFPWIGAGQFHASFALQFDPLAAVLTLVVTGVGSLIHIYSVAYMGDDHRDDGGFQRFFCYLNLFTAAMLFLVLAENLLVFFLGWEGVGLCSYLLIGFWYGDRDNAYCGSKAFLMNRIGDFGFLCGMLLLYWAMHDAGTPTMSFSELAAGFPAVAERTVAVPTWFPGPPEWRLATLIGLALFLGAVGKSAQIPLFTWLPDAMAGPTPVSALIHAATMVTAGVYMVCRMSFLYAAAPGAAATVAWVGGVTAFAAATVALAQSDIKKILAYSTVSQLGYMFLAVGCGAYAAGMFHVVTHAFFKALLFLAAGAVILALHHEQDIDAMGGLGDRLPLTRWTTLVGVFAIAGLFPFAGFFSKDEILLAAWGADSLPGHRALYWLGLATAGLTAFYAMRLYARVFCGPARAAPDGAAPIVEPGRLITSPLVVLAVLATLGGIIGLPGGWSEKLGFSSLPQFLAPVLAGGSHHDHPEAALPLALLALLVSLAGLGLAYTLYVLTPGVPGRLRHILRLPHRWLRDRYYVDELYDAVVVRPLVLFSDRVLFRGIDARLIDEVGVNSSARAVRGLAARFLKYAHAGFAQGYLATIVVGTVAAAAWLWWRAAS